MWIRSQDKKRLVKVMTINIYGKCIYANNVLVPDTEEIFGEYRVGEYESEYRALQVLDQVQDQLVEGVKHDDIIRGRRHQRNFVFQMPQE